MEMVITIVFHAVLIGLNILASLAIRYDYTQDESQAIFPLIFVWSVPYFGAYFVLKIIYEYTPDIIPKYWIPWPFKHVIYGYTIKHKNGRADNHSNLNFRDDGGNSRNGGDGR